MGYLIPANSKKQMLIAGAFNKKDLIIILIGGLTSLILLLALPIETLWVALIAITPGLITAFLVFPIPNYHNMLVIIRNVIDFYGTRQKYVWKGWCFTDGEQNKE